MLFSIETAKYGSMHCYLFGENVRDFSLLVTFSVDAVFSLDFYLPQNFGGYNSKCVRALIIASGMVSTGFARLVKVFFLSQKLLRLSQLNVTVS